MRSDSLRLRLLRRLLWPLILMLAIGESTAYLLAQRIAIDSYDMDLLDDALDLSKQVQERGGHLFLELPTVAKQMLENNNGDLVSYAVADASQALVAGDVSLIGLLGVSVPENYSFSDTQIDKSVRRTIILRSKVNEKPIFVIVSETVKNRTHLMARLFISMLVLGGILILMAVVIILAGVSNGLRPLQALHDEIVSRSATDLSPIDAMGSASELKVIIRGINELLEKLAVAFSDHRRFIANAAHQLRTPLAALAAQIEVGLVSPPTNVEATLQQLLMTTRRTAHLANQFLSLARLEHTEQSVSEREDIDFNDLIRDVTSDFLPLAAKKDVDMGFDLVPFRTIGSRLLLRELLSNILDNAIRYVPQSGLVQVTLSRDGDAAQLSIADNGPGVALTDLDKLGVPFYRLTSKEPDSSGLGLAIAFEIARLHNAVLWFSTGIGGLGLSVNIRFRPLAEVPG